MAQHVYHWKHGWIPLDHSDAHAPDAGVRNSRDAAKARLALPSISDHADRRAAALSLAPHTAEQLASGGSGDVRVKADIARRSDPATYAKWPASKLRDKIADPGIADAFREAMRRALADKLAKSRRPGA